MATFPEISTLDFTVRYDNRHLVQGPVGSLDFPFQHSANFDHYRPRKFDFIYLDSPTNEYAVLRSDLASCYWETLKMKGRYILSAANDWNSESALEPLPVTIPEDKLKEIGMVHPPFPPIHQLTYNFLLLPERPITIRGWIEMWQENSRQLSTWICKAKVKSDQLPMSSWNWPPPPDYSCTSSSDKESDNESAGYESNSSIFDTTLNETPELPRRVAQAFRAETERNNLKRGREFSPEDNLRDGSDSNKKQLILWQPSIAQLLEMHHSMINDEISLGPFTYSTAVPTVNSIPHQASGQATSLGIKPSSQVLKSEYVCEWVGKYAKGKGVY